MGPMSSYFTSERVDTWLSIVNVMVLGFGLVVAMLAVLQFKLTALRDRFADERIAANEAQAKRAIAEAAEANLAAAWANQKAAEAESKTAEALLKAAQIGMALDQTNVRLENEVWKGALGYIQDGRRRALLEALKGVPKYPVRVYAATNGGEAGSIAWGLRDILREAGFDAGSNDDYLPNAPSVDRDMYFLLRSIDPEPPHFASLRNALAIIGLYRGCQIDTTGLIAHGEVGIVVLAPHAD